MSKESNYKFDFLANNLKITVGLPTWDAPDSSITASYACFRFTDKELGVQHLNIR
jgi:hypothetical protein